MAPTTTATISVLLCEQDGVWSAQCLEYDIAVQAKTLPDLYYEVERIVNGYFAIAEEFEQEPFAGIPQAPKKFWDIFEQAKLHVHRPRSPFRLSQKPTPAFVPDLRVAELQPA